MRTCIMSSRESFYVLSSKRLAGDIISLFCPFLDHRCGGVGLHKEMNVNTEIHDDPKYHYFWPIKFVVSGLLFYGLENGLFFWQPLLATEAAWFGKSPMTGFLDHDDDFEQQDLAALSVIESMKVNKNVESRERRLLEGERNWRWGLWRNSKRRTVSLVRFYGMGKGMITRKILRIVRTLVNVTSGIEPNGKGHSSTRRATVRAGEEMIKRLQLGSVLRR